MRKAPTDFRIASRGKGVQTCHTPPEAYRTHPAIREACESSLSKHVAMLERDIAEALRTYGGDGQRSAESLAIYMQAVIQGAFIFAKAQQGPAVAAACLDHLRRYIQALFSHPKKRKTA